MATSEMDYMNIGRNKQPYITVSTAVLENVTINANQSVLDLTFTCPEIDGYIPVTGIYNRFVNSGGTTVSTIYPYINAMGTVYHDDTGKYTLYAKIVNNGTSQQTGRAFATILYTNKY